MVHRFFSPVAPVSVLEELNSQGLLDPYNLVLSHNVVQHADRFGALARSIWTGTWILDNSVIELGRPVDPKMIASAHSVISLACGSSAEIVCVLPDELLDGEKTVQVAYEALNEFHRNGIRNLMYVPQGTNMEEIIRCAEAFQNVGEVRWIGVAKNFTNILGSRQQITKVLQSIFPTAKFHMLGFSRNTIDDILCTKLPRVVGIDSSMPLRARGPLSFLSEFPKRGDWWQEDMELTNEMAENIIQVRKWLTN